MNQIITVVPLPLRISKVVNFLVGEFVDTMNSSDNLDLGMNQLEASIPDGVNLLFEGELDLFEIDDEPLRHLPDATTDTYNSMYASKRREGADLWTVFAELVNTETHNIQNHRLSIAAYSDIPDSLQFIPDIVISNSTGSFLSPLSNKTTSLRISSLDILETKEIGLHIWPKILHGWASAHSSRPNADNMQAII